MNKVLGTGFLGLSLLLAACGSNSTSIIDGTKPVVNVSGLDATGKMTVNVTPVKNASVKSVAVYDNGNLVATDTTALYSTDITYTSAQNGSHVIRAVVTDSTN